MTIGSIRWEANAFLGFFERQRDLYKRYWIWEVAWFAYGLVSTLSIGYLATGLGVLGYGTEHVDLRQAQLYLLIGALMWGYMSFVFFEVAFAIAWERWEGTIEYTFMAPVRRSTHLMGVCLFAVLYGLVRSALVTVVLILLFHLDLSGANLGAAAVLLALSTIPLVGLGIFTSILPMLSPEKGEQLAVAAQGVLLLVSGVYYPVSVLPVALRLFGIASPLTYTLESIRATVLQGRGLAAVLPDVLILAVMGAVLIPTGLWCFARAERRAKRLGLLKRNG
jgi:ABC-2 type transport system permease protein